MTYRPSVEEIRAWVGAAALQRGRQYVRQGRVLYPRRMGNTLQALCRGQAIEPYRVEIRLGENEILRACCTCPAGSDGTCKHVAAVLLQWQARPEDFIQPPPLAEHLQAFSSRDLIRLILRMVERYPDLAEFVWLMRADETDLPPKNG